MNSLHEYIPTKEDTNFLLNTISLLRDGGVWGIPASGMMYRIDKRNMRLVLVTPAWDETPLTMLSHHRNTAICKAIGWKIEPDIDWDNL